MTDGDMTPLREGAAQLHEMYVELKRAGFTRSESMELVAKMIATGMVDAAKQQNEDTEE